MYEDEMYGATEEELEMLLSAEIDPNESVGDLRKMMITLQEIKELAARSEDFENTLFKLRELGVTDLEIVKAATLIVRIYGAQSAELALTGELDDDVRAELAERGYESEHEIQEMAVRVSNECLGAISVMLRLVRGAEDNNGELLHDIADECGDACLHGDMEEVEDAVRRDS